MIIPKGLLAYREKGSIGSKWKWPEVLLDEIKYYQ